MSKKEVTLTELVSITSEAWNEIGERKSLDLKELLAQVEYIRNTIIHDEDYNIETFPMKFPIQKFIRTVLGECGLKHPDVVRFRRAMTVLASVVHIKLPANFVLMDDLAHSAAVVMMNQARAMRAEEEAGMHPQQSSEEAELVGAMHDQLEKSDTSDIVQRVLNGETTYQNDPDFMASALAVDPEQVEMMSPEQLEQAKQGKAPE